MRFNLKHKIIGLITVFTALSVFLILIISIQTFQKDKTAFVFETSLNTSRFLSEQLKVEVESKAAIVKNYLKLFLVNRAIASPILDVGELIDQIQIYELKENEILSVFEARKESQQKFNFRSYSKLNAHIEKNLKNEVNAKKTNFFIYANKVYIYEFLNKSQQKFLIIYSYDSKVVQKIFNENNYFKSILIAHDGELKAQNFLDNESDLILKFSDFNFSENSQAQQLLNTSVFMLNSNTNEKWMFASAELGYFDLFVITTVSEYSAFGFFNKLYINSALLFGILVLFVIVVGFLVTHFIVRRLQQLTLVAEKVSTGDFSVQVSESGRDEVGVLSRAFNNMIRKIDVLLSEVAGKTRMELELKTAQIVQSTLFPPNKAALNGLEISGYYKSASECGGDWWCYYETSEYVWVWVADATGHGVSAALLTSACKSAVHLIKKMNCEPEEAMKLLNSSIYDVSAGKMMMTCFVARFDRKNMTMKYVNASHEIPILIPDKKEISVSDLSFVFSTEQRNMRLGQQQDSDFMATTVNLTEKIQLFFFTDGFFELKDEKGNDFKERQLLKKLVAQKNKSQNFSEFTDYFDESIQILIKDQDLQDDLTYMLIEVAGV